jgi:acyl-coenzyme A thioesterase PaaI-like protein
MTEIWDEPARGGFPPEGFLELTGIDRARARVQGLVPRPPIDRLLGIRFTHASPGTATMVQPASPWLQRHIPGESGGNVSLVPLVSSALHAAAGTVAPAGATTAMHVLEMTYVRRPTLDMDSFVARGRCIAAGPSRATVEVNTEDADGRLGVHATGQAVFGPAGLEQTPGALPTLERVVEPSFSTPDPPARPLPNPDDGRPAVETVRDPRGRRPFRRMHTFHEEPRLAGERLAEGLSRCDSDAPQRRTLCCFGERCNARSKIGPARLPHGVHGRQERSAHSDEPARVRCASRGAVEFGRERLRDR